MKHLWIFLTAVVLISHVSQATGVETMLNNKRVTKLINDLAPGDGPGIQYVIVDKDKVIFENSSGLSDIKNKTPLRLTHTMAAFSMTKTITAIAVLQLSERPGLRIDDKAARFIEHPYSPEITIRQLLNHTSGIPNPIPLKWVHLVKNHSLFDEGKALAVILEENPKSVSLPGEEYRYSNIGYWLLGKIIEAVTQQDYQSYIQKNIFEPLGLKPEEIDFAVHAPDNHAKGYLEKYSFTNLLKGFVTNKEVWGGYEGSWLHIQDVYVNGPAFGGLIGSAKAFSCILQNLLSENSVVLSQSTERLLYSQQKNSSGKNIDMTLGWHIGELNGIRYFFKEGGGAGFHCEMRVYPSDGLASVIMTNRTSFNSRRQLSIIDKHFISR